MSLIEIENLSKRYGNLWAVRDFSARLESGEIFGLLGATAAGKSTILRMIAGVEPPNSGSIVISGEDVTRSKPENRSIAAVFQNENLPASRATVAEFFAQNLKAKKFSKEEIKKRIADSLALFNVTDLAERQIAELSAVERQTVTIATAISANPQILLLDDCFSSMHAARKNLISRILKDWAIENGAAVILATQNQEDAFIFCDRIAVLEKSETAQIGTPIEVYQQPESAAVAAFFGSNNLIRAARLTSNKAALSEFQTIEGSHRLFVDNVEKSRLGAINQIVTLAIRPENLVITFGAAFPEDNLLKAVITEIQRFGATTKIKLDADGLALEALVLRLIGLKTGDICLVGLPPNRITVLKS